MVERIESMLIAFDADAATDAPLFTMSFSARGNPRQNTGQSPALKGRTGLCVCDTNLRAKDRSASIERQRRVKGLRVTP